MKAWAFGFLLLVAVLAEKATARPGEPDLEDEDFQHDEQPPVPALPPNLKSKPVNLTPQPGETVVFPCDVDNAPSPIWLNGTYTLFVGDRPLSFPTDTRKSVDRKNHSLKIVNVQPSDSAKYTCKISNDLTVVHELLVKEPPRLLAAEPTEQEITLEKGQHIRFRCNFTGFPEPRVTWTRKGRDLPSGKPSHRGDHLHFSHVEGKHSGTYVCSAVNELGHAERSFTLAVSDGPHIEQEKSIVNTGIGESAELACITHAYPPAKVTWDFGGHHEIKPSNRIQITDDADQVEKELSRRHILRINGVSEADLGIYHCLAVNEKGSARIAIKLTGVPTPAVLDQVTYEHGNPVLYWSLESSSEVRKYELMYRLKTSESGWTTLVEQPKVQKEGNQYKVQFELKDVIAAEYEAKLKSQNEFGWSDLSVKFPFAADTPKRAESSRLGESGNAAPVVRIPFGLLLGCFAVLLLRS